MASYVIRSGASYTADSSRDTSSASLVPATPFQSPSYQATVQSPPAFELIPHRVFVGGFPSTTTEAELRQYFENHGHIREVKVIRSTEGTSKGYGFVTFDSEEEAQAPPEQLEFRGRRLNVGPAMRRLTPTSNRYCDYAIAAPQQQLLYSYQQPNGVTYIPEGYAIAQPQPYNQFTSPAYIVVPPTPSGGLPPQMAAYTPAATPSPVAAAAHEQQRYAMPTSTPTSHYTQQQAAHSIETSPPKMESAPKGAQRLSAVPQHLQQPQQQAGHPLTPVTPGAHHFNYRWQQQQQACSPMQQQYGGAYYQPAFVPGAFYGPTDMTHYSQMVPPAQLFQQQEMHTAEIMQAAGDMYTEANARTFAAAPSGYYAGAPMRCDGSATPTRSPERPPDDRTPTRTDRSSVQPKRVGSGPCPVDPITPERRAICGRDAPSAPSPAALGRFALSRVVASSAGIRGRGAAVSRSMPASPAIGCWACGDARAPAGLQMRGGGQQQQFGQGSSQQRSPRKSAVSLQDQMNQCSVSTGSPRRSDNSSGSGAGKGACRSGNVKVNMAGGGTAQLVDGVVVPGLTNPTPPHTPVGPAGDFGHKY